MSDEDLGGVDASWVRGIVAGLKAADAQMACGKALRLVMRASQGRADLKLVAKMIIDDVRKYEDTPASESGHAQRDCDLANLCDSVHDDDRYMGRATMTCLECGLEVTVCFGAKEMPADGEMRFER